MDSDLAAARAKAQAGGGQAPGAQLEEQMKRKQQEQVCISSLLTIDEYQKYKYNCTVILVDNT